MFKATARIIKWTGKYKKNLYLGFVYSFFASIATAMPIMVAALALHNLILDYRGEKPLEPYYSLKMLVIIVAFVLLRFLFSYLRAINQESIACKVGAKERIEVGGILKRVPLGYFSSNHTGDISSTITTELSFIELLSMSMIDNLVNGYINVGVMIVMLAFFSLPIALISLAGVLLSMGFLEILKKASDKTSPVLHKAQEDMAGSVIEYVRGMAVVKAFGQSGTAMASIHKAFNDSKKINIGVELKYGPVNMLHLLVLDIASVGIVIVSAIFALNSTMPLPYMLMMLIFSFSIFAKVAPINNSSHSLGRIEDALNNLEKLKETDFIDTNGKDIELDNYDISFNNVRFAYDKVDVIKDVSFDIPQNTTTAIVGPSGCGKTTLCSLLARFYDIDSGSIIVGGRDVREFTCDSLMNNISMVFQNVYLFHDTIKNNIAFGKADASMDEIIAAAKQARCHDFIMELPKGYDTLIGEGGSSLSGGEKQRVSIARAILKDAPIIILDEATASIDPENEHLIQAALTELTAGKTVIIIAHRLATIQHADQIVVLEEGRVIQKGRHEELSSTEGLYGRFINIIETAGAWSL
ncbi:MAG: ABC transporter ATP-binding protein [Spirochaetales bacterium]|nr:ABC transporter ATP-binding protein [Spirochaetales bacterium]